MVMAGEEDVALEGLERIVECLDGLQVKVVRGAIEDERIRILEHHTRDHAAHLLSPREDRSTLEDLLTREEHTPEEALEVHFVGIGSELREPLHEVHIRIEVLRVIQWQISLGDGLPPFVRPFARLLCAIDDLEERSHSTRITADEDDLIVLLHVEVQVTEEERTIIGISGKPLDLEDLVPWVTIRGENNPRIAATTGLDFLDIELLEHLLTARSLLTLSHVGTEAADELLELLLLFLSLLILLLLLTQGELAGLIPEAVVTSELLDTTEVNVYRVRADRVEEVTVVTDDQHRLLVFGEVVFEPSHRLQVEVVGRFVQEEVVGLTIKRTSQEDTHLFLTAQLLHQLVVLVFLNSQTTEQHRSIALCIPAFHLSELIFQLSDAVAILIVEVRLSIQCILLFHDCPEDAVPHQDGIHHGEGIEGVVILAKYRETLTRAEGDATACGIEDAADGTQQGRLTSTVGTDDAIAVTWGELKVDVLEKDSLTELYGEVADCNHIASGLFLFICLGEGVAKSMGQSVSALLLSSTTTVYVSPLKRPIHSANKGTQR